MWFRINLWVQGIVIAVAFSLRMVAFGWLMLIGIIAIPVAVSPLIVAAVAVPPRALNRYLIAAFLATDAALVVGAATFPDFDDTGAANIPLLRVTGRPDPSNDSALVDAFGHVGIVALLLFLLLSMVTLALVIAANVRNPR